MKPLFDQVSMECSKLTTKRYSTSFSLGIRFLCEKMRDPIYAIYGYVRFADEIVDSFHGYNKEELLHKFREDTYAALRDRISLNPILNSFQAVVHEYNIRMKWIDLFMDSMEMDLGKIKYTDESYKDYILGSAEVVGLMCLHVFVEGNDEHFDRLQPYAMRLGAAFQKVNFLRDIRNDYEVLGRVYFPAINLSNFSREDKAKIEQEIQEDFGQALIGIKMLPMSSRSGVYLAYKYYLTLFRKIKRLPPDRILHERIRVPNSYKLYVLFKTNVRLQLNML